MLLPKLSASSVKVQEGDTGTKNVDFFVTLSRPSIRPGFHAVTPYLIVAGAARLIAFAAAVFGAEELRRDLRPDGTIMNAELRIGDAVFELAEAGAGWPARPGALHVYVRDTDETPTVMRSTRVPRCSMRRRTWTTGSAAPV